MKTARTLFLGLLLFLNGMPVTVFAQATPPVFALPDAVAGQTYRANVESVLRETYRLKLETNARIAIYRWTASHGELPLGLFVRPNGSIVGVPREARAELYRFQLKVLDISAPRSEPLTLDFTMTISAPRVRLAHINAPKLVPTGELSNKSSTQSMQPITAKKDDSTRVPEDVKATNNSLAPTRSEPWDSRRIYNSMLRSNYESESPSVLPQEPCDSATALGSLPSGDNVVTIDARNGAVEGKRQFARGDTVTVVIDNKNPYLYKYAFSKDEKIVEETVFATFFPFFGGIVSDFAKGTSAKDKEGPAKAAAASFGIRAGVTGCTTYSNRFMELDKEVNEEIGKTLQIADPILKGLEEANNKRSKKYDDLLKELHKLRATSGELYCKSKELLAVSEPGASPDDIKLVQKRIDALKNQAESFKTRVDELSTSFPDCADMTQLNRIRYTAEGLLSDASKYEDDLKQIKADLTKMNDLKKTVQTAVNDPANFRETHQIGPYSKTTEVSLGLKRTSLSAGDDKEAKAEDLVKAEDTKLKFGHAPFFSLSGGMVFSPLRKFEFDRIQGFERDQQGNLVLVNGKPNLTTVVGLKETSRTRITPIVFLNGRVHEWDKGPIDGLHISLGITAKNDNKGLDPEFLVGPSLSMLERKLFFTFGGYAGRQQKLTGGLFEGFAIPSTVTDLPIQKNYRWSFGFALSYQLPINSK